MASVSTKLQPCKYSFNGPDSNNDRIKDAYDICRTESNIKVEPELKNLEWTIKDISWNWVFVLLFFHIQLPYSLYIVFTRFGILTFIWNASLMIFGGLGVTAGAHRLWSHRSYKANTAFQIFVMLCFCLNLQKDLITWVADHRVHHKYTDTDADPHNSRRGFFYSHYGWLILKDSPAVKQAKTTIKMDDITSNPILIFNKEYHFLLALIFTALIPVMVPVLFWNEPLWVAYHKLLILRYTYVLNFTFSVNSFAHMFGTKPYDRNIRGRENHWLSYFQLLGEGWHNYHHTFPHDYRASEFPWFFNLTCVLIDFFAWIGWIYDRKTVSTDTIEKRKLRTGDPHHYLKIH